jgi:hypothetical protein
MESPYADAVDISFAIKDFASYKTDARVYTPVHVCGGFRYALPICDGKLLWCPPANAVASRTP